MQNYNFSCGSVWASDLVSDIEEHRLRVFENVVLTTIFEPKRDEVTRGWRILERWDGLVWTGLIWLRIGTSRWFL
jgi:hypothetical protein